MPDYMFLLESRLSPEQRALVLRVQELAQELELNIYLTGGAVRDLISGMPIRDLDFTVEGNPTRMTRELEKGGARVVEEDEKYRHMEFIFAGDVEASLEGARDDHYASPGSKAEVRWATVADDLRRRDFSVNAIALSLNAASRGLVLDPMNGLADLERREIRALSMHSFTNQPVRLLRALLYCARLGFKLEQRTEEWFDLALSRDMQDNMDAAKVGEVVRQFTREANPVAILKFWEVRDLLASVFPAIDKHKPRLDDLARLMRAREGMWAAGIRPRQFAPTMHYLLKRLSNRERLAAMRYWGFSAEEVQAVDELPEAANKLQKLLKGRKTRKPEEAYAVLAQTPPHLLAFVQSEYSVSRASSQIRNYLAKWRPLRLSPPIAELTALGVPRGAKFDEVVEKFFVAQLRGKGRDPEERARLLKKLAGIKDPLPKKVEKGKAEKVRGRGKAHGKAAEAPEAPKPPMPPRGVWERSSRFAAAKKLEAANAAKAKALVPAEVKPKKTRLAKPTWAKKSSKKKKR